MITLDDPWDYQNTDRIDGYIQAVVNTLCFWVLVHYDPDWWAEFRMGFGEFERSGDPIMRFSVNGHEYTVDISDYFAEALAESWEIDRLYECRKKKCVNYRGIIDYGGGSTCDECGKEGKRLSKKYSMELLIDIASTYSIEELDYDTYIEAIKKGHPQYLELLGDYIHGPATEMIAAVFDILSAETNTERLAAVSVATQIYHVNGSLMSDYGDNYGLEFGVVDEIRCSGYEEVFGPEYITEFIEHPVDRISIPSDFISIVHQLELYTDDYYKTVLANI